MSAKTNETNSTGVPDEIDSVSRWLIANGYKVTRANWLNVAYMGCPPDELSAEEEAELPEELQRWDQHNEDE